MEMLFVQSLLNSSYPMPTLKPTSNVPTKIRRWLKSFMVPSEAIPSEFTYARMEAGPGYKTLRPSDLYLEIILK